MTQKKEEEHCLALVYETLRRKLDQSDRYFCDISFCFLFDIDHKKVFDAVTKVEKRHARTLPMQVGKPTTRELPSNSKMRCVYSGNIGHF